MQVVGIRGYSDRLLEMERISFHNVGQLVATAIMLLGSVFWVLDATSDEGDKLIAVGLLLAIYLSIPTSTLFLFLEGRTKEKSPDNDDRN